jgi:hypothetical protein
MVGWERQSARWLVAGTVVCGILLAVGLALHSSGGWNTAASVVTVMAVFPMIGGVLKYAQAKQRPSEQKVSRDIDVSGLLRDLVEANRISRAQLRAALPDWDADAFLDGTSPLTWSFISAFLDVIAGGDRGIREGPEPDRRRVSLAPVNTAVPSGIRSLMRVVMMPPGLIVGWRAPSPSGAWCRGTGPRRRAR